MQTAAAASVFIALLATTTNVAGAAGAVHVDPGPGTYTFSGAATLTGFDNKLHCRLTLTGSVRPDPRGGVTLTVTHGNATGAFVSGCALVGFDFPWRARVDAGAIPADPSRAIPVVFHNVVVKAADMACAAKPGTISLQFYNGDPITRPSSFHIDAVIGRCSVAGVLRAKTDVNLIR